MKRYSYYFFLVITCCIYPGFTSIKAQQKFPTPVNLQLSDVKSCSLTLTWSAQEKVISYTVRYKPDGGLQSAPLNIGLNTSYTYSGLEANKTYTLKVAAVYTNGKSDYATLSGITATSSLPENPSAKNISPTNVQITWEGCPSENFQVRYRNIISSKWISIFTGSQMHLTLEALQTNADYVYQICSGTETKGNWTRKDTFRLADRPNVLVLLMDDARINTYSCQNGPSFLYTPAIDRICHEGAQFENNFVACSLCVPGRASLLTGLYPHHHGAIDLEGQINAGLPTLPVILNDAGYYTAMVGKYHMSMDPVPGWDYWLATTAAGTYFDKKYNLNGQTIQIGTPNDGDHSTNVITDTAVAIINRAAGNIFLWVAYNAPHDPLQPPVEYSNSFKTNAMPIAGNLDRYNKNYPSFLYNEPNAFYLKQDSVDATTRHYYQCILGIDSSIKRITETLEKKGILDNTIIILTSDNGRLIGEHGLNEKIFPYEESIRVPIWIRYPRWFSDSTVIDQFSMNIDVAPTILEAAGIDDTFHFDGTSLRKLANGESFRNNMMYEYLYSTSDYPGMPWMRGIRDSQYKYVKYGCNNTAEEFFDIQNDPLELTNLINENDKQSLIQNYRDQLSQLRSQCGDTHTETLISCELSNTQISRLMNEPISEGEDVMVTPNPAITNVTISGSFNDIEENTAQLQIMNVSGRLVYSSQIPCHGGKFNLDFDCRNLNATGQYFIRVQGNSGVLSQPFDVIK
ncbi:MAG: sulfatase-like hydrolase/transferase [Chitinophagales bacterium]|nr:sulfatase-like hydrolase/transferase [Chitinophagales bacterium]